MMYTSIKINCYKMKNTILFTFLSVFALFHLSSCCVKDDVPNDNLIGELPKYIGTWTLSEATEDFVDVGTLAGVGVSTITFNEDGTYSETHTGSPSKPNHNSLDQEGVYTENKATDMITFDSDDEISTAVQSVSGGTLELRWTVSKTAKSYTFRYTK